LWLGDRFVLSFSLKIAFEMVEQTDLFLELEREVFEVNFFYDIFLFNSFNVEEIFLAVGEHLSGVIKVDSDHIVA
jgi:hypothetical protein